MIATNIARLTRAVACLVLLCVALSAQAQSSLELDSLAIPSLPTVPILPPLPTLPVISLAGAPAPRVGADETYRFVPQVTLLGVTSYRFDVRNLPVWASLNTVTGIITGNPGPADVGTYENITLSLVVGDTRVRLPVFSISVDPVVPKPTALIKWQPPLANNDSSLLDDLIGYEIAIGSTPETLGEHTRIVGPALNTYNLSRFLPGKWYFAIRAFNSKGVYSEYSAVAAVLLN